MTSSPPIARLIALGVLAWISMLAVDFFLHAGILADFYAQPSPFLLPPEEAFRRIPLGYLSFLILDGLLLGLMVRLQISSWQRGLTFGLILGAAIWGATALGSFSISTASPSLLLGWFLGQTVELGVAGAYLGSGLGGTALRYILLRVIGLVLVLVVATVVLQNLGQT